MNNYCTGQWNAKDENINDHASYWPIVGILKALVSFCTLSNFAALFLFSPTNFRTKADFASQLPFACMDLEADKPLRKVRGSCHIFRGRC